MSATTLTHKLTYEDLERFPNDGQRYEIIDGELFVSAAPSRKHQRASMLLSRVFYEAVESSGWGQLYVAPVDVAFGLHTVVQPDLLMIRRDRLSVIYRDNPVRGAPDALVEILSPTNRAHDERTKMGVYQAHGVPEVWLVDADAPWVRLFVLRDGVYARAEPDAAGRLHSTIVPGLVVDPAALFAELEEDLRP